MNLKDIIAQTPRQLERQGPTEPTRLRAGDIIEMSVKSGATNPGLVWHVNDCRAMVFPLTPVSRTVSPRFSDKEVSFESDAEMISISPSAEYPFLQRLGEQGMVAFLEAKQMERNTKKADMEKNKQKKAAAAENEGPKLGRLGGFKGHSITSAIRAFGLAGWAFWEVRHVFEQEKIAVADNTIRIQLSAGRNEVGGAPAEFTQKELKAMRPDPSLKPARKNAAEEKPAKKKAKAAPAEDEDEDEGEDEDEAPPVPKKKAKPAPEPEDDDDDDDETPAASEKSDDDEDEGDPDEA